MHHYILGTNTDEAIVHEKTLAHANNKQQLGFKIFLNIAKAVHQKQRQDFQLKHAPEVIN